MSAVSALPPKFPRSTAHRGMPLDLLRRGHTLGGLELEPVPLTVVDRQGEHLKSFGLRNSDRGCGIESARQQNHCWFGHAPRLIPPRFLHRNTVAGVNGQHIE